MPVHGIHHVTAIAGDPAENLAFYTRVLGLRLVKRSVNQDAPDTYHLFYADATGSPGTDLTFFPWPAMGLRIRVRALALTARLLEETLGFREAVEDRGWVRYAAGDGSGAYAEVAEDPAAPLARWGTGGVHHVAWRTKDVDEEMTLRAEVERAGLHPTPLIDRFWFRSVYFKEPGGTLFELATDGPGFALDEKPEHLGETLVLPPWLEPRRAEIEAGLPALPLTRQSPTSPRTMGSAAASNPPRG